MTESTASPSTTDPAEWAPMSETDAAAALAVVDQFVGHVRAGDKDAAATLLDGFVTEYGATDDVVRRDLVDQFVGEHWGIVTAP